MAYRISHTPRATSQLEKLDRQIQRRITARIEKLAESPRPSGCVQLTGHPNLYRIRVGDYRVVYSIDDGRELVEIALIAHRREVYRDL